MAANAARGLPVTPNLWRTGGGKAGAALNHMYYISRHTYTAKATIGVCRALPLDLPGAMATDEWGPRGRCWQQLANHVPPPLRDDVAGGLSGLT